MTDTHPLTATTFALPGGPTQISPASTVVLRYGAAVFVERTD